MWTSSEYLNVFRWRTYICQCLCSQTQPPLLPDSVVSASRFGRVCSLMRMRLLPRSLPSLRIGLRKWGERGRECGWRFKCLLRVRGPHFASKVSYRAGAAGWGQNRNIKGEGERRLCRWGRRKAACRRGGKVAMPRGAFRFVSLDDVLANDVAHAPGGLEIEAPSYCVNVKHFSGEEEVFAGAAFQGVFVDR